jgi:uncharacterized phage-associated protein
MAVIDWLNSKLDTLFEDAVDRLTSPSWDDAREFARVLEHAEQSSAAVEPSVPVATGEADVFSGYRPYSFDKMAAVVSYLAARTSDLYKTKLNKLLFYSDFIHYYRFGHSLSGSRYLHLPYGPVPDGYEETLETLQHYGVIDIARRNTADLVRSGDTAANDILTEQERSTLDWVLGAYGNMSTGQLTDLSHREKAYKFTRTGEEIAYDYAKFFRKLPPKAA